MREEFEKWYRADMMDVTRASETDIIGVLVWRAWQASRQSLVVKLPELYETPSNGNAYFPEEITDALDEAGVRYE